MKNWILGIVAMTLFSVLALGQATPISSTPDQPQSPAAAAHKSTAPSGKAKVYHTKSHHRSHKKHHKSA